MNILVVEDESRVAEVLEQDLLDAARAAGWAINVRVAEDRDAAVNILHDTTFPLDFIILDLQIPPSDEPIPADRKFGLELLAVIREHSQGTKTIVFSGRADPDAHTQLMAAAWTADCSGEGIEGMIDFLYKEQSDECVRRVNSYALKLQALDDIGISFGLDALDLSPQEARILRIYARRLGAQRIRVSPLKGGRSGSRTLRVHMFRLGVQPFAALFAKIDTLATVRQELRAYNAHVAPRLAPGSVPAYADIVDAGAANLGGIFFRLADSYSRNVLDVLARDEAEAIAVATRIRERTSGWHDARVVRAMSVGEIREIMLPTRRVANLESAVAHLPIKEIEAVVVETHCCSQHGDLHLLNALASTDDVILIDFARATDAPASLDPLTLELGLVFHPDINSIVHPWPSPTELESWWQLDDYLAGCPFPAFVRFCRTWAHDLAATDEEVAATAYAYAMRQLRWPGRRERALALISAALQRLT